MHNRTNFDLTRHTEFSGKDMQYIDQDNGNERYIPYIIETSAGLTRNLLMFLCDAYEEQKVADKGNDDDWRTVLHFHPVIAPITVAVLPLMKKTASQSSLKTSKRNYAKTSVPTTTKREQSASGTAVKMRREPRSALLSITTAKRTAPLPYASAILWIRYAFPCRTCKSD